MITDTTPEQGEELSMVARFLLTPALLAEATGGTWVGDSPARVGEVRIDSRLVEPGDAFVALIGERHDAHDFLLQVVESGAACAIVSRGRAIPELPCLEVDNPLVALQEAGRRVRAETSATVIAITGSNGKTTTRSLLASSLADDGVLEPVANFNNHIGVPLTLTRLTPVHRWAVLELGMNHLGEISLLSEMSRPDVAVITNVGRAHLGPVGGLDAVRRAKVEIVDGMAEGSTLFVPASDPELIEAATARIGARDITVVRVGTESDATVNVCIEGPDRRARFAVGLADGPMVTLGAPGRPLALAAAMTLAVCDHLKVRRADVARRVSAFVGVPGRMRVREFDGVIVIDDTYNANPDSMAAALDTLRQYPAIGRRMAVLGDMAELGDDTAAAHHELGDNFDGIDHVFLVGTEIARAAEPRSDVTGKRAEISHYSTQKDAHAAMDSWFEGGDVVLFKGSRSAGLDELITALFGIGDA